MKRDKKLIAAEQLEWNYNWKKLVIEEGKMKCTETNKEVLYFRSCVYKNLLMYKYQYM